MHEPLALYSLLERFHDIRACRNNNIGDQRARGDTPHAVNDDRRSIQLEKLFRRLGAHARTETCGWKNGGYTAHFGSGPPPNKKNAVAANFRVYLKPGVSGQS